MAAIGAGVAEVAEVAKLPERLILCMESELCQHFSTHITGYSDMKRPPSVGLLKRLIEHDPKSGLMTWKPRPVWMFNACPKRGRVGVCGTWNTRFAGRPAFDTNGKGYKVGMLFARTYGAHRVLYALTHGCWPAEEIDHINGDKLDNRIENLRAVSHQENCRNTPRQKSNTSGVVGVSKHSQKDKWVVYIGSGARSKYLGIYSDFSEACNVRRRAEVDACFHENHGRH